MAKGRRDIKMLEVTCESALLLKSLFILEDPTIWGGWEVLISDKYERKHRISYPKESATSRQ